MSDVQATATIVAAIITGIFTIIAADKLPTNIKIVFRVVFFAGVLLSVTIIALNRYGQAPLTYGSVTPTLSKPPQPSASLCTVPNIERLDKTAAYNAITELGLQVVKSVEYSTEIPAGLVISQNPLPNEQLSSCQGNVAIVVSLGPIPTPVPPTPIPNCVYSGGTDLEVFIQLIRLEEQAVLQENIDILLKIYAQDATIRNVSKDQLWTNMIERYQLLFENEDFLELEHFGFNLVDNTGNTAWVTSSARGIEIFAGTNRKREFTGTTNGDHWTFLKNNIGCWEISNLSYGAAHEKFP